MFTFLLPFLTRDSFPFDVSSFLFITALIEAEPKKDEPFYNDMMRLMYRQCMNQSKCFLWEDHHHHYYDNFPSERQLTIAILTAVSLFVISLNGSQN